ncbi:MAG: transcription antitermination factor NusB [Candidatus Pacebacteria bacterium]|nr:transcription antitermination factor NusB [Candidatus Paceibacterota bacterium]
MANRHLSRSIAMQVLFECDFNCFSAAEIDEIINRSLREFAPGLEDRGFVENLVRGVLKESKKLDSIIEKTAPEWPLAQIAMVDRNILRLGLYELVFGNHREVPPKVAINEAIELAKTFGGETSGKFVNGVLGTVYKEMGEPGKNEGSKISHENLPLENLGGAVVYRRKEKEIFFALVHDVFGFWTLSKGGLNEGEDLKDGTIREIKEELGLDIEIKEELGSNEYVASNPEKGQIRKRVVYFLAEAKNEKIKLGTSGGLDDARWFKEDELMDLKIYDDLKPIFIKAIKLLKS